jgi:hypothetical protein
MFDLPGEDTVGTTRSEPIAETFHQLAVVSTFSVDA